MEARQARDQPAHGDGRLAGHHQYVIVGLLVQALHGAFQLLEDRLGGGLQVAPGAGEEDRPVAPFAQLHAEVFLEQAHLAADGAVGHMQVLGGAYEAFGSGSDVEVAKGGEGRQFHVLACSGAIAGTVGCDEDMSGKLAD